VTDENPYAPPAMPAPKQKVVIKYEYVNSHLTDYLLVFGLIGLTLLVVIAGVKVAYDISWGFGSEWEKAVSILVIGILAAYLAPLSVGVVVSIVLAIRNARK
jgi:hypothetical protein